MSGLGLPTKLRLAPLGPVVAALAAGGAYLWRFAGPDGPGGGGGNGGSWRAQVWAAIVVAAAAAAIAILLYSLWIDRRLFRPLARLLAGAGALAAGRARRVEEPEPEELAVLARSLNRLADAAETQFAAVRSERDYLQSILASMSEGVLVVGPDRRASSANPAFRRLFDLPGEVAGRPLLEISRHPELARVVEDTLRKGEPQSGQLELQVPERRTLLLASDALSGGERGAGGVARAGGGGRPPPPRR
jgi:two-component system phosphate regulon sensor histidine kinase PhoR